MNENEIMQKVIENDLNAARKKIADLEAAVDTAADIIKSLRTNLIAAEMERDALKGRLLLEGAAIKPAAPLVDKDYDAEIRKMYPEIDAILDGREEVDTTDIEAEVEYETPEDAPIAIPTEKIYHIVDWDD